jgi:thioredoxin 1
MDEVTDATFDGEVLGSDVPVIVEFGAPWCRPCKAIEPALAEIADGSGGRLRLVKLDIDANLRTPSRYGVLSVPTVILFQGGEPRETLIGAQGKSRYERAFAPYVDA